ncbi:MAG: outer membrane beta-barrel protein [Vicinamibacterales bacterium]
MQLKALTAAIALTLVSASYAAADPYVSPWAGVNFGTDIDNGRGAFGVRAGAMGGGAVGGEINLGFSPSFFGTKNDFGNNTVLDVMANLIIGIPIGGQSGPGIRPFVTGGLGLIPHADRRWRNLRRIVLEQ